VFLTSGYRIAESGVLFECVDVVVREFILTREVVGNRGQLE